LALLSANQITCPTIKPSSTRRRRTSRFLLILGIA
jgi:hypothetical protein